MIDNTIISPLEVLIQYTDCFENADETKAKFDLLLDTALSSEQADDWSTNERADIIFFCRQTQLLLGAMFSISESLRQYYNVSGLQKPNSKK